MTDDTTNFINERIHEAQENLSSQKVEVDAAVEFLADAERVVEEARAQTYEANSTLYEVRKELYNAVNEAWDNRAIETVEDLVEAQTHCAYEYDTWNRTTVLTRQLIPSNLRVAVEDFLGEPPRQEYRDGEYFITETGSYAYGLIDTRDRARNVIMLGVRIDQNLETTDESVQSLIDATAVMLEANPDASEDGFYRLTTRALNRRRGAKLVFLVNPETGMATIREWYNRRRAVNTTLPLVEAIEFLKENYNSRRYYLR